MNKPSQYLIDKTENEQVSRFLKQQINKSNIKLMNARTKTFQHLNTLTPYSVVTNPFEHSIVETEVKTHKEEPKPFIKPPQVNVQVTEAQKVLRESEQKQHKIVTDMAGILKIDKVEHDLTGIRISQKREAQFIRDQIYFRPTQFEIDKKNEQEHKFTKEEYTTEEGLDFMDNRVPKRVVELEKLQQKVFEGKKHSQKGVSSSNLQQTQQSAVQSDMQAGTGVVVQDPALITKPKLEVQLENDALDVNLRHPILRTAARELLRQSRALSPVRPQFISGKCTCECHDGGFGGRVCLTCLCVHEGGTGGPEGAGSHGGRVNNFNLLQDVAIPMYKQRQQSILHFEGHITPTVLAQMLAEKLASATPAQRIQDVADQVIHLANKLWSVALRSNVSPNYTINQINTLLSTPSDLGVEIERSENDMGLKEQYEMVEKSKRGIVAIQRLQERKLRDFDAKGIAEDIEKQMQKTTRNVSMDEIVQMRKKNNDTLLSLVREVTGEAKPLENSLVKSGNHEYLYERLEKQEKLLNDSQVTENQPKRINYLNRQDGEDTQIAALKSFTSPFRKPPGCLSMLENSQNLKLTQNAINLNQTQQDDIPIIETSNEAGIALGSLGDKNPLNFIPLSPTQQKRTGARANSPFKRRDIISRQNQEMRQRLSQVQSRVHSPGRKQIITDARIKQLMEQKRIETQDKLVKLVQETNMNKDEIRDMMRRTHKKLVQIDKQATKNAKTVSPIDFKILYGRKHGYDH